MKQKLHFPAEGVWALGVFLMAMGVACISKSNFGYSMVVAPVYLLFTKLSAYLPFLTFGVTEYLFQGLLILLLIPVTRRFRPQYLLSFLTAVIYGYLFDFMLFLVGFLPVGGIPGRCLWFAVGEGVIVLSVVCFMHTYLAPEAYELVVKEIATVYRKPFHRVKLIYDLSSLLVAMVLSLALFGGGAFRDFTWAGLGRAILDGYVIEGIGVGTVVAALVGGPLIGLADRWFTRVFDTTPLIPCFRPKEAASGGDGLPMGGGTDLRATRGEPTHGENADVHGAKPDATPGMEPDTEDTAAEKTGATPGESVVAGTDASRGKT